MSIGHQASISFPNEEQISFEKFYHVDQQDGFVGKDIWAYDGYPSSTPRLHTVEENETLQALFSPPKVHADVHTHKRNKDFYQDKNKKT